MQPITLLVAALAPMAFAPAAADVLFQMCGADITGHDVGSYAAPNPDTCAFLAPNVGDCATWTNYNGGTCWLKKGCDQGFTTKPNVGAMSVVRYPSSNVNSIVYAQNDADMPGFDFESHAGAPGDCQKWCGVDVRCFAYVWTNYNGGTCWLKSRTSAFVYKPGAVSYVVRRPVFQLNACPRL